MFPERSTPLQRPITILRASRARSYNNWVITQEIARRYALLLSVPRPLDLRGEGREGVARILESEFKLSN